MDLIVLEPHLYLRRNGHVSLLLTCRDDGPISFPLQNTLQQSELFAHVHSLPHVVSNPTDLPQ